MDGRHQNVWPLLSGRYSPIATPHSAPRDSGPASRTVQPTERPMAKDTRILVCGGGIGGLIAALALLQRDFGVTILEQAPHLTEIGAGVQLAPNATRVLRSLGLGAAIER